MATESRLFRLSCQNCSWHTLCGPPEMLARLQQSGMLKRDNEPEWVVLRELFTATANRFACNECGQVGLQANASQRDDEDWPEERACECCHKPIPIERLEVFPDATRCVTCQDIGDPPDSQDDADFCIHCGSLMSIRQHGGTGITRYKMVCSECGR